jgi:hypothetical protein
MGYLLLLNHHHYYHELKQANQRYRAIKNSNQNLSFARLSTLLYLASLPFRTSAPLLSPASASLPEGIAQSSTTTNQVNALSSRG